MNINKKRASKGFTLLEILLVIAAIGILASIVLVAINPNRQIAQARNAQRRADVNTIYKAIEQYLIDTGSYPAGITTTLKDICQTGNITTTDTLNPTTLCDNKVDLRVLVPNYLASIPVAPAGGEYRVSTNEENNRIRVTASNAELGQIIVVNPAVEERIQAQIAAGTLVPTGTQTLVEGRLVYTNNAGTQTYIDRPNTTISCPTGYIPVPGSSLYQTNDFCVMKYEAKTGSATVAATTQAAGNPQVNITQPNAITACSLNGAGYGLINNNEWMTIARNIEGQGANWTGGTVGSGGLWRGHSDGNPNNALEASTDNDPYFGTGNVSPSIERRTHTLSNGEVIWDISGNVWEWTSDTILGQDKPNNSSGGFWQQWTVFNTGGSYGQLSYDLTRPSNTSWNSTQNMGQYYAGTVTGTTTFAFLRGGNWNATAGAGVFALLLINAPSSPGTGIGFRCVLR
jgi:prepilin-type N-terminal cleavage/methylation domain-containing protein